MELGLTYAEKCVCELRKQKTIPLRIALQLKLTQINRLLVKQ